jgi:carbamoyl-phosphate synthase large subunit
VLIPTAGTGAANNLIRSLRGGDPSLFIVGFHCDRFVLKMSSADRNYLTFAPSHPAFADILRKLIEKEAIDLIFPYTDDDVLLVSTLRDQLPCRVFLPSKNVIELCQDKYELTTYLRSRGIPAPETYPVNNINEIVDEIFQKLAPRSRVWCRIRFGCGSMGAAPMRTPQQARAWIEYWEDMRGVPAKSFTLSEYLPGRDFACQNLWKDGQLILIKTVERLSYFGGVNRASGVSSIASLAKTVYQPTVAGLCAKAISVIDPTVSGAFTVDLKENASGTPCITEINVGRFITTTNLFDFTGKQSMTATYVRLALDEPADISEIHDVAADYYFARDVDTIPGIFHANDLFEDIRET